METKFATYLHGRALARQPGESDDVTEVDGDIFVQLCLHHFTLFQLLRHWAENKDKSFTTGMSGNALYKV